MKEMMPKMMKAMKARRSKKMKGRKMKGSPYTEALRDPYAS